MATNASIQDIGQVIDSHQSFALLSHICPDGDAIGSQIGLGMALIAAGKSVRLINEHGVPENLAFLPEAQRVEKPSGPVDVEVVIALDTATHARLGSATLEAVAGVKHWINIDHHISNPGYGQLNYIDPTSPATGQIVYELLKALNLPIPPASRDAIYVAVSTDTGSFQYPSTTAKTYEMAADLVRMGLDVGDLNSKTYDNRPYRRVELTRALLNTLVLEPGGLVAHWQLTQETFKSLNLLPEDSEGLIDMVRSIQGVQIAIFFEELPDGKIRISMRSKSHKVNVSEICSSFGGGGHKLAAGIRMAGPMAEAKAKVIDAVHEALRTAGLE